MVNAELRLIIFFAAKDREGPYSQQTQDLELMVAHEFLTVKFRFKLKKVGKTSSPFSYDLNQTPYDYTVEVTNRFQGLDLIDTMPDEVWTEFHNIVQKAVIKTIPKKKKCKKPKC